MSASKRSGHTYLIRGERALTSEQFHQLTDVARSCMVASRDNPRTRCAYENDLGDFMTFSGIE